jgi:hypothetical protein
LRLGASASAADRAKTAKTCCKPDPSHHRYGSRHGTAYCHRLEGATTRRPPRAHRSDQSPLPLIPAVSDCDDVHRAPATLEGGCGRFFQRRETRKLLVVQG